jgi:hypothetical protein
VARPKAPIDAKRVEELATLGLTAEEIAAAVTPLGAVSISHRTVEKRFNPFLKKGRRKLNGILKRELMKQVREGNTAALIFALKALCGLRERDPDNVNVNVTATAAAGSIQFSPEERKRLEDLANNIQARVFKRSQTLTNELAPSGNGDHTALN